ncbi:MAG: tetratricopeptide repeat protein [Treponema sp.]|nr:tetratricopeptide repeat protein [Candidatus Treponema equifaecale]
MAIQPEEELKKAYLMLEEGKTSQAMHFLTEILSEAMVYDYDGTEINFALWCCSYWDDFIKSLGRMDHYEQGESLIARWKAFRIDYDRQKKSFPKVVGALQKGIFTLALDAYESLSDEQNMQQKAEINRKLGLCCKKLGKYEAALEHLTEANQYTPSSAAVLAEMADCFALCGEEKKAKVLFREAFFIDAQKIELSFLDSELIGCLVRQVKEKGFTGAELQEWIPVYGVLYGVFNVKRELRTHEVTRLRGEIYAKENDLKDPANDAGIITPKLINMYFWLIDYYVRAGDSGTKINEYLLQIRVHNENIYRMYTR